MKSTALVVAWCLGCGGSSPSQVDAKTEADAVPPDAVPACSQRLPLTAIDVESFGIDGSVALVATADELLAVPLDGGPPISLETTRTAVGSHAGVAYYAIANGPNVDVRTRDGSVHATFVAAQPSRVFVDATNIYVVATASGTQQLWRVARAANPQPVAIATLPAGTTSLALGSSIAAFKTQGMRYTLPLPGGGTPTPVGPYERDGGAIVMVGDVSFDVTSHIETSHTFRWKIERFLPSAQTFFDSFVTNAGVTVFGDDRHLYVGTYPASGSPNPSPAWIDVRDLTTGAAMTSITCSDFRGSLFAYDATKLYGVELLGTGSTIVIAPREP